jgi:hypothetical protein
MKDCQLGQIRLILLINFVGNAVILFLIVFNAPMIKFALNV